MERCQPKADICDAAIRSGGMAFDLVGYKTLRQDQIQTAFKDIRRQHPEFWPIKEAAEMLKHVRLLDNGKVTVSSTGIQVDDQATWMLKSRPLEDILDQAGKACSSIFPST